MPHESTEGIIDEEPPVSRRKRVIEADDRVAVRNAADSGQVKDARRKEKERDQVWLGVLAAAETSGEMQILLLHIMERCSIFMSVWHDNPAKLAYNAGQQDLGHWLVGEVERMPGLMQKIMSHRKE